MAEDADGTLYPVDQLRALTLSAFKTVGVPDEDAAIYAPGEIEAAKKARRLVEGIPIPDGVKREFEETAADLGISFP
jgi:LDH2 family malate/lactate/ureidoglycolate dehydrogenase